jgi:hypothetical protein
VQLYPSFIVHGVFDDTEKTLVWPFADGDSFTNQLVTSELLSRRRCHGSAASIRLLDSWVHATEIRSSGLCTPTLGSHGDNVRASNDEDAGMFDQFSIVHEEDASVDVDYLALTVLSTVLLHSVVVADLGSVSIGRDSVAIPSDNTEHLCMEEGAHVP